MRRSSREARVNALTFALNVYAFAQRRCAFALSEYFRCFTSQKEARSGRNAKS